MYENNTAAIKIENEVSRWYLIGSGVKEGFVLFPFVWIIVMDSVSTSTRKTMAVTRNQMGDIPGNFWT